MNALHQGFHDTQTALQDVMQHTRDPKLPGTLFGQALNRLRELSSQAAKDNRPVAARLLDRGADAWISRPDFPTMTELENMMGFVKQAHATIHDDDPHDPAELQRSQSA